MGVLGSTVNATTTNFPIPVAQELRCTSLANPLVRGNLNACSSPLKRGRLAEIMNRLLSAMNAHDVDAFVACFASDYESEQPAHPGRTVHDTYGPSDRFDRLAIPMTVRVCRAKAGAPSSRAAIGHTLFAT